MFVIPHTFDAIEFRFVVGLSVVFRRHAVPVDGLLRDEGGVRSKGAPYKGSVSDIGELFPIIIALSKKGNVGKSGIGASSCPPSQSAKDPSATQGEWGTRKT